ncbi:hypothetical protein [Nocardia asiatica]|uniref:hypothetical protein n=1 Tax=Nocardia asiatica TaxID=209252 RepID=UPI002453C663|nr:hypothetical protein [Nocardia asiatica]
MTVDYPLDDDSQGALSHPGVVRAFHRQRWAGGFLAVDVLVGIVATSPLVQTAAHIAAAPIAGWIVLDLIWETAKSVWRLLRGADIIVIKLPRHPGRE